MSGCLIESFDIYNGTGTLTGLQSKWTLVDSSGLSMISGRFGGQALRANASISTTSPTAFRPTLAATGSTFSAGFALRLSSLSTDVQDNYFFCFRFSGTTHLMVGVTSTGRVKVVRGDGTTLNTSTDQWIFTSTWVYVEVEASINDTTGTANVYVNDNQVCTFTGDTRNGSTASVNEVFLTTRFDSSLNGANVNMDIDDIYVITGTTRLGPSKIETIRANGNASVTWTPLSGDNWANVDETLVDGDTTYVYSNTLGQQDLYDLGALSTTPATVHAVQVSSFARKTDAGSRAINNTVKSGATTSQGSNYNLSSSYGKYERLLDVDPDSSGNWTATLVNALQVGPRVAV